MFTDNPDHSEASRSTPPRTRPDPMRVLVTGAAGSIGRVVLPGPDRPRPRGRRARPGPEPPTGLDGPWHTARLRRPERPSTRSCGASGPTRSSTSPGIPDERGAGGVAASPTSSPPRRCSTRWSPTTCTGSSTPRPTTPSVAPRAPTSLTVDVRPRPDTFYGVGQGRGRGACSRSTPTATASTPSAAGSGRSSSEPSTLRNLSTWLSHDDCVRMVEAALTAPAPGYAVLYGISANTRALVGPRAGSRARLRARRTTPRSGPTGSPPGPRTRSRDRPSAGRSSPSEFYRSAF